MIIKQKPWPKMAQISGCIGTSSLIHSSHSSQPRPSCWLLWSHTGPCDLWGAQDDTTWRLADGDSFCVLHCRSTSFRTKSVRSPAKNFLSSLRDIWHKHFLNSWSTEATKQPGQWPQSASELSSLDLSLGSLKESMTKTWLEVHQRRIQIGVVLSHSSA